MGNDFFYSGKLNDEILQEKVVNFAKSFSKNSIVIELEFSFSKNSTLMSSIGRDINIYGVLIFPYWDTDSNKLGELGQLIFDRTSGGELITLKNFPQLEELMGLVPCRSGYNTDSYFKRRGNYRSIDDGQFALFLYIIKSRYFPDLTIEEDFDNYGVVSKLIEKAGIHSKLIDEKQSFEHCWQIFQSNCTNQIPNFDKKRKERKLPDFFCGKLPTKPIDPEIIILEDLNFGVQVQFALEKKMKCRTLSDLLIFPKTDLIKVQNLGENEEKTILEFLNLLEVDGFV